MITIVLYQKVLSNVSVGNLTTLWMITAGGENLSIGFKLIEEMDKRQRNLAIVSIFVVVVVVLAVKSIYKEIQISGQNDNLQVAAVEVVEDTADSPWNVKTDKKIIDRNIDIDDTLGKVEKTKEHKTKDSVQELKMFCVCTADGCNKCIEIEEATKSMYANNEDVNIKFTTLNMKDRDSKDFVDQMQIKDESVVLIKGWRKKKVKLSNFKEGEELESSVKKVVDNI